MKQSRIIEGELAGLILGRATAVYEFFPVWWIH